MILVTIAGRLGKNAELRQVNNDTVCSFSVAGDTGFGDKKQSHWFNCSLWGKQGEALAQYLVKGSQVTVIGEFSEREHEGKFYKELRVNQIAMQGGSQNNGQNTAKDYPQNGYQNAPQGYQNAPQPNPYIQQPQGQDYAQNAVNHAQSNYGNGQVFNNNMHGNIPTPSPVNDDSVPF